MTRPIPHPGHTAVLPPALCGTVADYVVAWAAEKSGPASGVRFDKRWKSAHRFSIADTRGRVELTVPIAKPDTHRCLWDDICISTHGAWWDVHRVALESAYGRTPYFEFYIDRFLPMLTTGVEQRFPLLGQLQQAWDVEIRDILGLGLPHLTPAPVDTDGMPAPLPLIIAPSGQAVSVKLDPSSLPPYRQIRADRLGFIGNLSVIDLIFNLGPEAQLYLNAASRRVTLG